MWWYKLNRVIYTFSMSVCSQGSFCFDWNKGTTAYLKIEHISLNFFPTSRVITKQLFFVKWNPNFEKVAVIHTCPAPVGKSFFAIRCSYHDSWPRRGMGYFKAFWQEKNRRCRLTAAAACLPPLYLINFLKTTFYRIGGVQVYSPWR